MLHTLYISYFIERNGDGEPRDSFTDFPLCLTSFLGFFLPESLIKLFFGVKSSVIQVVILATGTQLEESRHHGRLKASQSSSDFTFLQNM